MELVTSAQELPRLLTRSSSRMPCTPKADGERVERQRGSAAGRVNAARRLVWRCYGRAFMLEVRNLSKGYGGLLAVESLSFTLEGGEVVALLGPNGAGKSTTLTCVAGYQKRDSGTVLWNDRVLGADRSRHIALVPETPEVWGSKITSSSAPQLVARRERPMTLAGWDFALGWWARCCIRWCVSGWT
jgi:ABC-type multidrug transport system fused ATPase/permease subunit